ncbi:PREDICTED: uncharacterized protein LOC108560507 [Nicrophorus vespilloides]|uniref:Uncharacterized protein LOC108560507 n=1 Tax=Nicrophorus vespilloides TaxID=110193 RepID=A0ABM1MG66_NICVS|nr:PREDICTED: uncharacterized protein LOC108560507 [Nicrophorus vespilloides]
MSKTTRNTKKSSSIKSGSKEALPENVFDIYHGDFKVCDIPKTGPPKPDPMVEFRPKSKMIKDYNIDQTYAVMDKGPVKLKYRYTEAEYEFYPPDHEFSKVSDKIRSRKQHGRGPLEELLQDAWAAVVEKHQKKIKEYNMKNHEEVRLKSIKEKKATEKLMLRILGPAWYQELSPKQCKVVDNLDQSMKRDMKHKSVSCTIESLASLGLVKLPYHKHVELALSTSCGCPVEFLLILYDLRHPKRNVYSINERLLLSAVVRLTLRSTLKELHIRIPSPPGSPRKVKKKHAKVKPVHYESPYLVPYTFVPKPWIFNKYQKADKEYPQSFFFSYKEELIENLIKLCSENNIIAAVTKEEDVVESSESSTSNISSTKDGSNTCNLTAKTECKLRIKGKDCLVTNADPIECKLEIDYPTSSSTLSISSTTDTDCYAEMEKELVKEWIAAQRYYNKMFQTKCVSALHKTSIYIPCFLKAQTENRKDSEATKTDDSVSMVEEIPAIEEVVEQNKIECVDTTMPCIKEEQEPEKATCDAENEIKENGDEEGGGEEEKSSSADCGCGCCLTNKSETDEESIITKNSNSEECCALKQEFPDIKRETSNTLNVNVNDTDYCFCKDKILQDIRNSCCQCEQCEADRRAANAKNTMIIADTKQNEDGDNVKIISGFKSEKICTCMEKYKAKWEKADAIRDVRKAQEALKSLNEKFVITGTTMGKDGKPVYILSSVQPKQECECIRKLKEIEEDKKRIALMPTLPEGCNQYIITGVHARPEGNIYILSGARKNPSCSCMNLYDEFTKNHSDCLELFEEYMKKIKHDTEEYMQEMNEYSEFIASENITEPEETVVEAEELDECPCACVCEENMKDKVCSLNKYIEGINAEGEFENEEESECSLYNLPADECCCDCLEEKESIEGPCGVTPERPCKIEESFETIEEIEEEEAEEDRFNRYIILNKLPEDPEEQLHLLKKALSKLAEDGYPLARLPEIHKLPHFKLWLKMRCRNFWTQKDKAKFIPTSKSNWKHVDMYRKDVRLPKKYFLLDKPEMQNWRYAKTIKDFNMSTKENFYRNVKWRSIDYARQLYPTFVSYEFPTKAFRDVFYAYLNSNENDVTPIRMWLTHEYRDQTILRKRCR